MGIFNKLKMLMAPQEEISQKNKSDKNFYEGLGIVEPFTVLADRQFNSFIGELAKNNKGTLNKTEQEAFECLWSAAGIDMGGTGNNIWNLKTGNFEIYNKDGVILKYEKRDAEVKDKYSDDKERANFVYLSADGNFIINQNSRNQKVFLVYVSKDITDRLLSVLSDAEAEALDLEPQSVQRKNRIGVPQTIQEKYKIDVSQTPNTRISDNNEEKEKSEGER